MRTVKVSASKEYDVSVRIPEADCRKIADDLAKNYISLSEYKVICHDRSQSYQYTYYREVSGYETSDQLYIAVKADGSISSFANLTVNSFAGITSVIIDEEKAADTLEEKMNALYSSTIGYNGFEIKDKQMVILHDGKIAILYSIETLITRNVPGPDGNEYPATLNSLEDLLLVVT